ncbi:hypothetical protein BDM02DRAFT_3190111 [Thelephora ganbajun]|uniref:Uncharacterized protein n=1 Tax=Thelephora ganbajun TaxID=370292 RepID=A0ACB6Z6K4_THEGA|nr:hypothetical protein BDM02DRAFT_3190111 [Thelephora ganbajun]
MNRTLEKNMCKLPDAVTNSEVPDLRERAEQYIDSGLQYACKSWHKHLVDEHTARTPEITSALHRFLENKFVFWLEVLSVLGAAREAIDALDVVTQLLEASSTVELANDYFRFVTGFFEVIEESAAHIYHTALPVSPQTSMVRKLYEPYASPLVRIVHGQPVSWDPAIVTKEYFCVVAVWSPCGRFIAISNGGPRTRIVDAATLKRLTILESPPSKTRKLAFSLDGRLLTSFNHWPEKFISWDLQAGVLVSAISPEQWDYNTKCSSITYSACGTTFGVLTHRLGTFALCTYNVHYGTHIYSHLVEGKVVGDIWTHGEYLRFAVAKPGSITMWEAGFTSGNTPTEVESLPLPGKFLRDSPVHSFHPTLFRVAFAHSRRIFVWDARRSKYLLKEDARYPHGISFSSDGRFFMYETRSNEADPWQTYLWKESPTGYLLHWKFDCEMGASNQLVSPNGESILEFGGGGVQLRRTVDPTSSPRKQDRQEFIVEFSPDETVAAVTRSRDNTITVLDLKSGDPLSIIDTGMRVHGQRVTGSTVVAADHEKVVTWDLPARDHVLNTKVNVNNSIQTVTTSCSRTHSLHSASISPDLHSIAIMEHIISPISYSLHLHDVPTGRCLGSTSIPGSSDERSWFTLDGCQIWYLTDEDKVNGLTIVKDSESDAIKLEHLGPTNQPQNTPWLSSRGYQITDDGWILGISGKRLLRLPLRWQSKDMIDRMWNGRFLALLHSTLPEVVILELEE